ncbi:hypothetical protein ACVOMS_11240 [Bradyrhizobium guangxiense]
MKRKLLVAAMFVATIMNTASAQSNFESSKLSPGVVTEGAGFQSPKMSSGIVMQNSGFQSSKISSGVVMENTAFQSSKLSVGIVVEVLSGSGSIPRAPLTHW